MSHTGKPHQSQNLADSRIPFPRTEAELRCRTEPKLFAIEEVTGPEREKVFAKAKRACSGCPIVTGCLKWALANPELTPTGCGRPLPAATDSG